MALALNATSPFTLALKIKPVDVTVFQSPIGSYNSNSDTRGGMYAFVADGSPAGIFSRYSDAVSIISSDPAPANSGEWSSLVFVNDGTVIDYGQVN